MRYVTWILALIAGCTTAPVETTITEIESVCVDGDNLTVKFAGCLSSSCDTLESATCTATQDGDTVDVSGEAIVSSQGNECTADCGLITATCALPSGVNPDTTTLTVDGEGNTLIKDAGCAE